MIEAHSSIFKQTNRPSKVTRSLGAIGVSLVAVIAAACSASVTTEVDPQATETTDAQAEGTSADANAAVTVDGEALAPFVQGQTDEALGETAPQLEGTGTDGAPVVIEADGRAKVVYFLAHWCPACQAEVPEIQSLIEDGQKPDELDVYAVSTGVDESRGNFPPSAWLDAEGFQPPTMKDDVDNSALIAFGAGGFPYAVYLDGEGAVTLRTSGQADAATTVAVWQQAAAG